MVTTKNNTRQPIDLAVGAVALLYVGYMVFSSRILLGLVTALIALSMFVPIRQERYEHLAPLGLGWAIAIIGYMSTDGRFAFLSILLGIGVYIAWSFYRLSAR